MGEICPDFLKALDVAGLPWLTRLCNISWTSGAVSGLADWGGSSSSQKNVTVGCAPITGTSLHSLGAAVEQWEPRKSWVRVPGMPTHTFTFHTYILYQKLTFDTQLLIKGAVCFLYSFCFLFFCLSSSLLDSL